MTAAAPAQSWWDEPARRVDLTAIVAEFLRVLGLLEVVHGRCEYFVGCQGAMLLRDLLVDLFYLENGLRRAGGRKRLNSDLTIEQAATLAGQPPLTCDRCSVVEAHRAVSAAFLPRAHALLWERNLPWPVALVRVTQQRLRGLIARSIIDPV